MVISISHYMGQMRSITVLQEGVETLPATPVSIESAFKDAFSNANVTVQDFSDVDLEIANMRNFTPFLVEIFDSPTYMESSANCLGSLTLKEGMLLCPTLRLITWSLLAPGLFPTAVYDKAGAKVSTKLKKCSTTKQIKRHTFEFGASVRHDYQWMEKLLLQHQVIMLKQT